MSQYPGSSDQASDYFLYTGKLIIILYEAIIILIGVILEKPFRNIENVQQWTLFLVIRRHIIGNIQYYILEVEWVFPK